MPLKQVIHEWKVRHLDPSEPIIVGPNASLADAVEHMRQGRAGYVFVCEGDSLVGVLTERDLLMKVAGQNVGYDAPVSDFMTRDPRTIHADEPIAKAMCMMNEGSYRHLPLVDEGGKVIGAVTTRHLINFIVEHFPQDVVNLPPKLDQKSLTVEGG